MSQDELADHPLPALEITVEHAHHQRFRGLDRRTHRLE
jgi:hypothetical protein